MEGKNAANEKVLTNILANNIIAQKYGLKQDSKPITEFNTWAYANPGQIEVKPFDINKEKH